MPQFIRWRAAIEAPRSTHTERIAKDDDDDDDEHSPSHMHILVDFHCETIKRWVHYRENGQQLFLVYESHLEPKIEKHRTWFDFTFPTDEDLKKLVFQELEVFDLRDNEDCKGKLAEKVISHARNLIRKGHEKSSSLVVKIQKTLFYVENRVLRLGEIISADGVNMVPASMSAISSLPKKEMVYGDGDHGGVDELKSCTVCLEEIEKGTKVSTLPCSHVFHGNCIVEWLKRSRYCPMCRFEMPVVHRSYVNLSS